MKPTTTSIENPYLPDIFHGTTSLYGKSVSAQRFLVSQFISQYDTDHKILYISPSEPQQFLTFASEMCEQNMNKVNTKTVKTMSEQQRMIEYMKVGYENISGVIIDPFTTHYRLNRAAITNGFRPVGIDDESTESQALTQLEKEIFQQVQQLYIISHKRQIPIIVTNESYYNPDKERICPLGGKLSNRWYDNEFEVQIDSPTRTIEMNNTRAGNPDPLRFSLDKKYHSLIGDIQ